MKKDWEIKKLYEICEIECGTRVVRKVDGGTIFPVYGGGGATFKMDTYNRENCLIVSRFAMSEKCTRFVEGKFFLNDSGLSLRANEKVIYQKYLETVILGKNDEIYSLGRGAAQKNLDMARFRELEISYPKSLEEQKRIVKILDEKFAQLETIKAASQTNLQNAKDLFQSQLAKAFSNTTWEKKRLGDVFYVKSGGTPSRSKKEYWNGDIPWYSSGELGNRYTTNSERNINSLAIDNSNAKLFPKGSLLIGMYDTAAMKMSILDRDATFNQAIAGVKPSEEHNLQFIRLYLDSIKTEMFELRRGTRQKNLSLEKIKEIKIPLLPLPEQKRIVQELDALSEKVHQLQEIYTKQIANCDELKQSLLQKAFEGELSN